MLSRKPTTTEQVMRTYMTTIMAIALLFAVNTTGWALGIDTTSPDLPPDGVYVSPDQYHEYSVMGIVLDDPTHRPFVRDTIRVIDGDDEIETFDSEFNATEIGQGLGPISLTGPVQVRTTDRALSETGTFDTEIVSMSLVGNAPGVGLIMIREDLQRASTGVTDIMDLGGGLYHIDSFFDVFTELSVDGGATWTPSDYSTRMSLVPIPGAVWLLGSGLIALVGIRRRFKKD